MPNSQQLSPMKPYIKDKASITPSKFATYKKRLPKYLHTLTINKHHSDSRMSYLPYVKRAKRVQTLNFTKDSGTPKSGSVGEGHLLLKLFKKTLKAAKGDIKFTTSCHKNLPKLAKIEFDLQYPKSKAFKIFYWHPEVKHLCLTLQDSFMRENAIYEIRKNKQKFVRYFAGLKRLESLRINNCFQKLDILIEIVKILQKSPRLIPSVKHFILEMKNPLVYDPWSQTYLQDLDSISCLSSLTTLAIKQFRMETESFNHRVLQNLYRLNIDINTFNTLSEQVHAKSLLQFFNFRDLQNLKFLTLKISFNNDITIKNNFFEIFSLPASLESIELDISDMTCQENDPRYQTFYEKWKSLDSLKNLQIQVKDKTSLETVQIFVRGITMQLPAGLETFSLIHGGPDPDQEIETSILELKEFFEMLQSSKKTLKVLEISCQKINFGEDLLENDFQHLEDLSVKGEILDSRNLIKFMKNLSVKKVTLNRLMVNDLKEFEDLLESLGEVPENMELNLHLNLLALEQEKWWDSFHTKVEKLTVKGVVSLSLENTRKQSPKVLEDLKVVIRKKSIFKRFLLKLKSGNIIKLR